MIIKCPTCNGALEFDAANNLMHCQFCSSYYYPSDFDMGESSSATDTPAENAENSEDMMESRIYTCTACGAEIMVNDVEASTFCVYCGQPTIVFDRVAKMRKPKYIIPFSITREQAHDIIRQKFKKGRYIPKSIKNFNAELIRGIYVPFMVYDVDYYDRQLFYTQLNRNGKDHTYLHYLEANHRFKHVTVDSSVNFDDESSQRLEPYDLSAMKPFHASYLSGFYADCMDDSSEKMEATAVGRCKALFDWTLMRSVKGNSVRRIVSNPATRIVSNDYVMLPVWFLIFNEDKKHYTIMVNGQTGKIIGAVPYDKVKAGITLAISAPIFSAICAYPLAKLYSHASVGDMNAWQSLFMIPGVIALAFVLITVFSYRKFAKSQELTTSSQTKHLVSDRQGS